LDGGKQVAALVGARASHLMGPSGLIHRVAKGEEQTGQGCKMKAKLWP
jgi:hypothetical protein